MPQSSKQSLHTLHPQLAGMPSKISCWACPHCPSKGNARATISHTCGPEPCMQLTVSAIESVLGCP